MVASANPGCGLWLAGAGVPVRHPMEIVATAAGLDAGSGGLGVSGLSGVEVGQDPRAGSGSRARRGVSGWRSRAGVSGARMRWGVPQTRTAPRASPGRSGAGPEVTGGR